MSILVLCAIGAGVFYLGKWVVDQVRAMRSRRAAAIAECEKDGHVVERIHWMDDPRLPVDNCKRCPWQVLVRYWCPHCKKEITPHGSRTKTS